MAKLAAPTPRSEQPKANHVIYHMFIIWLHMLLSISGKEQIHTCHNPLRWLRILSTSNIQFNYSKCYSGPSAATFCKLIGFASFQSTFTCTSGHTHGSSYRTQTRLQETLHYSSLIALTLLQQNQSTTLYSLVSSIYSNKLALPSSSSHSVKAVHSSHQTRLLAISSFI